MASSGQSIAYGVFSSNAWACTYTDETKSNSTDQYEYYFICAPSFVAHVNCDYNLFASAHCIVEMYCYEVPDADTVQGGTWYRICRKDYVNGKNKESFRFCHNRNADYNNATFLFKDDGVSKAQSLFCLATQKCWGNSAAHVTIYAGGCGLMSSSEYYSGYAFRSYGSFAARSIFSNGRVTDNSATGWVWRAGRMAPTAPTSSNAPWADAVNRFKGSNNKGTITTASMEHHLISTHII